MKNMMPGNHVVRALPFALTKPLQRFLLLFSVFCLWINPRAFGQQTQTNLLLQLDWTTSLTPATNLFLPPRLLDTDGIGNIYAAFQNLSKFDPNGGLLWVASNNDFVPIVLRVDRLGNAFLAGTFGGTNFAAAKIDSNGNELWERLYHQPGSTADIVTAAQIDGNGSLYLTGASQSGMGTNILIVKFNSNGTLLWATNYAGPLNSDSPAAVALDAQGNVYITGASVGFGTGYDIVTLKYDANGNQLWADRYNGPQNGDDLGGAIAVDSQGNVFVCGASLSVYSDMLKYDPDGNQLWAQQYSDIGSFVGALFLAPDNLGGVYLAAEFHYRSYSSAGVLKYNSLGTNLWSLFFPSGFDQYLIPNALKLDAQGNALVAIPTDFVKISPSGMVLWSLALPGEYESSYAFDNLTTLAVDSANNLWALAYGHFDSMVMLAKFSQTPLTAPAAAILFPSDGTSAKYPAGIYVEATATEPTSDLQIWDGNIKINDLSGYPPAFNWNPPGGNHTLTARFTSQSGIQVTSAPVHLAIITNQFPIVTITNPVNGSYFIAPATIQIAAQANDPDGSVAKVDFYAPNLLGETTTSPYLLDFSSIPAGSYTLTAQATDNEGAAGVSPPVKFTVLPGNSPPLIVTEPQSQTVSVGTNVTFSIQAYGAPLLTYQWQFNGTNIAGQTNAQLTLTNVQLQASGIYAVVVTNQYGRVPSSNANLTLVSPALVFRTIAITSDGKLQLGVSAPSGSTIRVQTSIDLLKWTTLAQLTVTNQNFNLTYPLIPQTTSLYYRLAAP